MKAARVTSSAEWEHLLLSLPEAHLLQSWHWGEFKQRYGWQARRLAWRRPDGTPVAAAQVLTRAGAAGLTVLYCPRGPVLDWSDPALRSQVLHDLAGLADDQGVIQIKIDPDLPLGYGLPDTDDAVDDTLGPAVAEDLRRHRWRLSREQVQFRNTLTLDLNQDEDTLLAAMKQKTRYNIRLAERRGVVVRTAGPDDVDLLYHMYAETSVRDGFVIRPAHYYREVWGEFAAAGLAQAFVAEVGGEPVAGLVVYRFGQRAWYLYGMSRQLHRELMPNHFLQWEAIRWACRQGCRSYDFWGAPDRLDPADPMWGVYRFKEGFGARLVRTLGAWDFTARPVLYGLYSLLLPRLLDILRARGKAHTRRLLE
ncbi:MAG: peptidoglycan bridge formation glycyltransferase FemA/FemB family protein [Chloroflexota bacterium]